MIEQLLPGLSSAPNVHPMVVHFPIAFWAAATGAWLLAVARMQTPVKIRRGMRRLARGGQARAPVGVMEGEGRRRESRGALGVLVREAV